TLRAKMKIYHQDEDVTSKKLPSSSRRHLSFVEKFLHQLSRFLTLAMMLQDAFPTHRRIELLIKRLSLSSFMNPSALWCYHNPQSMHESLIDPVPTVVDPFGILIHEPRKQNARRRSPPKPPSGADP